MKLIRCDNPFRPTEGSTEIELASRADLLAYLSENALSTEQYALSLNGEVLPPEKLTDLAIRDEDCVVVMPVLGNSTLKSIALIGVAAAAIAFAGPLGAALFPALSVGVATALGGAIISIGGQLLVNGLASLFQKKHGGAAYTFAGPQTVSRSGMTIPKGYGVFQSAPNIVQSWVDLQHADQDLHDADDGALDIGRQWLNIIACFGFGPAISLSDIRINDADIASYTDVAYFIKLGTNDQTVVTASDPSWIILNQTTTGTAPNTAPTTDFNRIVNNYPQSQRVRCDIAKNYVTVTGQRNDTQRLDVTVQFPRGVWRYDENMVIKRLDIQYNVYYKLTTDTAWTLGQAHVYTNIRQATLRQITTIDNLPAGQYDVKVEKIGSGAHDNPIYSVEHESDYFGDELWLESVQETCYDALAYPNMILLGLRIMASDQISGANIQISAKVTYDTRVTIPAELSGFGHDNPALVAYDVLTDPLVGGGLDPANINLPIFEEWAALCDGTKPTGAPFPTISGYTPATGVWPVAYLPILDSFVLNRFDGPSGTGSGSAGGNNASLEVKGTHGGVTTLDRGDATATWKAPPIPLGGGIASIDIVALASSSVSTCGWTIPGASGTPPGPNGVFVDSIGWDSSTPDDVLHGWSASAALAYSLDGAIFDDTLDVTVFIVVNYIVSEGPVPPPTSAPLSKLSVFNGIFEDGNKTVWDSFSAIGVMGYATPVRIGTQIGVMLDEADSPVQVFGVGNIFKDSYSKDYLPVEDRANEVEVDYANADDDYKTRNPLRCIPEAEQDTGYAIKKTRVNLLGCTSTVQAYYWGTHRLLENELLLRTHKWDSPAQAIVCRVGNVVLLQHDVPQWASGGLIVGGTASAPILDAPYTFASGQTLTVIYPALKRVPGTITAITGNVVSVSGYTGATVKRLVSGSLDIRVTGYASGVVTVDDASSLSTSMSVDLYDTEVIAQETVTGISVSNGLSTLSLSAALPAAPIADSPYILAETSSQPKLVRIRGIKRSGEQKFSITAIDYDAGVYDIPVPNADDLLGIGSGGSAGNTATTGNPVTIPPAAPPTGVINPGAPGYGGSSVPSGNFAYTLAPASPLSQSTSTSIDLASVVATFSDSQQTYGPQTFTITDPGSTPTWYYVTADSSGTLSCGTGSTNVGDPSYVYLGSILATHLGGVHSASMPGGWPIPSTIEAES